MAIPDSHIRSLRSLADDFKTCHQKFPDLHFLIMRGFAATEPAIYNYLIKCICRDMPTSDPARSHPPVGIFFGQSIAASSKVFSHISSSVLELIEAQNIDIPPAENSFWRDGEEWTAEAWLMMVHWLGKREKHPLATAIDGPIRVETRAEPSISDVQVHEMILPNGESLPATTFNPSDPILGNLLPVSGYIETLESVLKFQEKKASNWDQFEGVTIFKQSIFLAAQTGVDLLIDYVNAPAPAEAFNATETVSAALTPLTPDEQALFDVLTTEAQTGPDIVARLARDGYSNFDESKISRMWRRPKLQARGVRHENKAGYYLLQGNNKTTAS